MIEGALNITSNLLKSIGKAGLHALYPNDFEYYLVALELTTIRGETIDYLMFPVTPNISKNMTNINNIKKNSSSVTALSSNTFNPQDISINGNFGRKFKFMIGATLVDMSALSMSTNIGKFRLDSGIGSVPFPIPVAKTGYGATKILQAIHEKSNGLDNFNQPFKLYFYNPTLGESYLVKSISLDVNQNRASNNMMWNFSMRMKILSHLDSIGDKKGGKSSLLKLMAFSELQKKSNSTIKVVSSVVKSGA